MGVPNSYQLSPWLQWSSSQKADAGPVTWVPVADGMLICACDAFTDSEFVGYFASAKFVNFFVAADQDSSGSLSLAEFNGALSQPDCSIDLMQYGVTAEEIFVDGDTDGDKELSFGEFAKVFLKLGIPADDGGAQ
eukprot:SAG11_NODE_332_length_10621_cov_13.178768_3_plen_135_part_00